MIPLFLVFEYGSRTGVDTVAGICFFLAGGGDYPTASRRALPVSTAASARLLDPFIDRLLVLAGAVACWSYELLPRWALAALLVRELLMLAAGQAWLSRGHSLRINWVGRIAVAPTMFGIWLVLIGVHDVGEAFFLVGLALAWIAAALYLREGFAGSSST